MTRTAGGSPISDAPLPLNGAMDLPLIDSVASPQLGLVTRAQLRQLGLSDDQIRALVRRWLLVVHPGVYRCPGSAVSREQAILAAAFAAGPDALASYGTAASLYRVASDWPSRVHITLPVQTGARVRGTVIHRTRTLE